MVYILLYSRAGDIKDRGLALRTQIMVVIAGLLLASGCARDSGEAAEEQDAPPILTAETLGQQTVLAVPEYLAQAPYADADPANGERQAPDRPPRTRD